MKFVRTNLIPTLAIHTLTLFLAIALTAALPTILSSGGGSPTDLSKRTPAPNAAVDSGVLLAMIGRSPTDVGVAPSVNANDEGTVMKRRSDEVEAGRRSKDGLRCPIVGC
ncbi:hypothetical protein NMY22_g19671 [Coprinellus aureogranulatus]|nr:hypothetical protein NMY22_g19671 [Coprinellus aureogranulatus]